jgi:hypothetical protein
MMWRREGRREKRPWLILAPSWWVPIEMNVRINRKENGNIL